MVIVSMPRGRTGTTYDGHGSAIEKNGFQCLVGGRERPTARRLPRGVKRVSMPRGRTGTTIWNDVMKPGVTGFNASWADGNDR